MHHTHHRPLIAGALVALAITLTALFALPVTALAEVASGTNGTVSWSISEDGELVFSPTEGAEGTFAEDLGRQKYDGMPPEWMDYASSIKSVRFEGTCHAVGDIQAMFQDITSQTDNSGHTIESIDLRGLETSQVTNMNCMFNGCSGLKSLDLSPLNTSQVTNMGGHVWLVLLAHLARPIST